MINKHKEFFYCTSQWGIWSLSIKDSFNLTITPFIDVEGLLGCLSWIIFLKNLKSTFFPYLFCEKIYQFNSYSYVSRHDYQARQLTMTPCFDSAICIWLGNSFITFIFPFVFGLFSVQLKRSSESISPYLTPVLISNSL